MTISFAGFATPFVVLAAFIAAICAAVSIGQMAKRLPSAGSFFTYNSASLGKGAGFVSGHLLAFGYIVFVPAGVAASAYFFSHFLDDIAGWKVNENIILVVLLAAIVFLAYEGLATSASVDMIILIVEILVIVALAVTILFKGGASGSPSGWEFFNPANSLNGKFSDLALAMVFTMVIFTGFESGATLGEESRDPKRTIPRGLLGAVLIVGVFYLLVSYSEMKGVASADMPKFAADPNQLNALTNEYWSPSATWLIDLVVALSTLAFTISTFNSGARLLFAMGREHVLPLALSKVSKRHTPPHLNFCDWRVLARRRTALIDRQGRFHRICIPRCRMWTGVHHHVHGHLHRRGRHLQPPVALRT